MLDQEQYILVFDCELMRPGCALLQATYNATPGIASLFRSETWITFPTSGLKPYSLSKEQLAKLVDLVEKGVDNGRST